MTKTDAQKFAERHVIRPGGTSCNDRDTGTKIIYRVEYGALRSVNADKACNYSYREFWF